MKSKQVPLKKISQLKSVTRATPSIQEIKKFLTQKEGLKDLKNATKKNSYNKTIGWLKQNLPANSLFYVYLIVKVGRRLGANVNAQKRA